MNILREAQVYVRIVGRLRNKGARSVCLGEEAFVLRAGSLQHKDLIPMFLQALTKDPVELNCGSASELQTQEY